MYRGRVGSSTGVSLRQTVWDIELLRRLSEKEEEWIELSKSFVRFSCYSAFLPRDKGD